MNTEAVKGDIIESQSDYLSRRDVIDLVESVIFRFNGKPQVIDMEVVLINQEMGHVTTIVRDTGDMAKFLYNYSGLHYINVKRVRYCALEDFKLPKLPQKPVE